MSMSSPTAAFSAPETCYMMSMKPGCRGDPRMNRAVAAKLKNPHISLFDALDIGGFTYPRNVDAATMDNDRVTLGQRKNQLNRRLRLARQSLKSAEKPGSKTGSTTNSKGGNSEAAPSSPKSKPAVNGSSPLVIANSFLRQQRSKGRTTTTTSSSSAKSMAGKRRSPVLTQRTPATTTELLKMTQPPLAKKLCVQAVSASSSTASLPSSDHPLSRRLSLQNALSQTIIAKHEHGNVSPLADDHQFAAAAATTSIAPASPPTSTTVTGAAEDGALWWPLSSSLFQPPAEQAALLNKAAQPVNVVITHVPMVTAHPQQQQNNLPSLNNNPAGVTTTPAATTNPTQQQSLADANMTLQQSAVAGQLLQTDQNTAVRKEELGLQLFSSGLKELYQRSMRAAGFTPTEMHESSQTFHKFAFEAWKNECQRLQVLLQNHVVNEEQQQQQNNSGGSYHHC